MSEAQATEATSIVAQLFQDEDMLRKDLREAGRYMEEQEARYLVNLYYQVQEFRKASGNMDIAAEKAGTPHHTVGFVKSRMHDLEGHIKIALEAYVKYTDVGRWLLDVKGIGPVIAAGLMAHIDITKAPAAGHIWSFAGLNPGVKWKKGQRRPWNAALKVLCWKAGDSFVKVSNREGAFYGHEYRRRKEIEVAKNEAGELADAAKDKLDNFKLRDKKTIAIYESGKLPDGHVDARARRATVKLFLSHVHAVMYWFHYGELPPRPYALEHLVGHIHMIQVPNAPWEERGLVWE